MATQKLEIVLSGKDAGATAAIRGVASSIGSLGKSAGGELVGNLQKIGTIGVAGIAALGAAAAAAAGGMYLLASNAEPLVGLQRGFEAVTARIGDSSAETLKALQDATGGLIENRTLMQSYNLAAALVGDTFAKTLPDAMGLVRRASVATGQDMGFLMDSLVRGVGRVSPMILDNLGIQIDLAAVTERAAEMFGKSADELSKQEQQMALSEITLEKLNEAYGDVPDITPVIGKVSTFLANMRDEIGLKLLPVVQPLVGRLLDMANQTLPQLFAVLDTQIIPVLSGVSEAFTTFFGQLQAGVDPIDALQSLVWDLGTAFGVNKETIEGVTGAIDSIVAGVAGVSETIRPLLETVGQWIGDNVLLKDGLLALGIAIATVVVPAIWGMLAPILPLVLTFAGLVAAIALLRQAWESNFLGIQDIVAQVMPTIMAIIGDVQTWITTNWPAIQAVAEEVWGAVQQVILQVVETVQSDVLPPLQDAFATIQGVLAESGVDWEMLKSLVVAVIGALAVVILGIVGVIVGVVAGVASALETMADHFADLKAAGEKIIGGFTDILTGFVDLVKALIAGDWAAAWESAKTIFGGAVDVLTGMVTGIYEVFVGNFEAILAFIGTFIETTIGFFQDLYDRLVGGSIVPDLVNDIVGWFGDLVTMIREKVGEFVAAGLAIVEGLKQGILNGWASLKGMFSGLVSNLIADAKAKLGIKSPSQIFYDIGQNIGEGLIQGLYSKKKNLENIVLDLLEVTGKLGSIGSTFAGIFKERELNPLEAQIESLVESLPQLAESLVPKLAKEWGMEIDQIQAMFDKGGKVSILGRFGELSYQTALQLGKYNNMLQQRNDLQEEFAKLSQKILEFEKQQQNQKILQSQLDLMDLIKTHGLDASKILGGLKLGLSADMGGIMEAITKAMQLIIEKAESELDIASPSGVFREIGRNMMLGLAQGIISAGNMVSSSITNQISKTTQINLTAQYGYQSESNIMQDVRLMEMMYG